MTLYTKVQYRSQKHKESQQDMYVKHCAPPLAKQFLKSYFEHNQCIWGSKVIDLDVIWKGIMSGLLFKCTAIVKVDNKQTNRQTRQKQYAPNCSIWEHQITCRRDACVKVTTLHCFQFLFTFFVRNTFEILSTDTQNVRLINTSIKFLQNHSNLWQKDRPDTADRYCDINMSLYFVRGNITWKLHKLHIMLTLFDHLNM